MYSHHHDSALCATAVGELLFAYSETTYRRSVFMHIGVYGSGRRCTVCRRPTYDRGHRPLPLVIPAIDPGAHTLQLLLAICQMAILPQAAPYRYFLPEKPANLRLRPFYGHYPW